MLDGDGRFWIPNPWSWAAVPWMVTMPVVRRRKACMGQESACVSLGSREVGVQGSRGREQGSRRARRRRRERGIVSKRSAKKGGQGKRKGGVLVSQEAEPKIGGPLVGVRAHKVLGGQGGKPRPEIQAGCSWLQLCA